MRHCDPERIALIALGDAATDAEQAHLNVCEACREDLALDRAVVAAGHEVTDEDLPSEPPARVWAAISAELNLDPALNSTALPPAPTVEPGLPPAPAAQLVQLSDRRERRAASRATWLTATAAAVAGIAIGALGATVLSEDPVVDGTLIAESQLATVPISQGGSPSIGGALSGIARIIDTDGQDYAEVDTTGLPMIDGFYEVWLIKSDLSGMISLGSLSAGARGKFVVPPGTDLSVYTIVDISVENHDGDPAHSRQSVLRGTLPT